MADEFDLIPEPWRDDARSTLRQVTGGRHVETATLLKGGISGAHIYRVDAGGRSYALRLEPLRIPLQHRRRGASCMQAAAEARVAPRVYAADPVAGVAVMDFVEARPIDTHPGGPLGVARDLGGLIAQLQTTPPFPTMSGDDEDLVAAGLRSLTASGRFAPGLLDRHREAFHRVRQVIPWERASLVSSHNDPNPRNLLSDGARLWMVDWELAARNDPLFDLAIATIEVASTPDLAAALLTAALGRKPDAAAMARLRLVRQLARLFYGCVALNADAAHPPENDLEALSFDEFQRAAAEGRFTPDKIMSAFGKMSLAAFLDGCAQTDFEGALKRAGR